MSCGPSAEIRAVADQIDNAKDAVLAAVDASPLGALISIKEKAEDEVNGLLGELEKAIPEMAEDVLNKAFDDLPLHDQAKDLAKTLALGAIAAPDIIRKAKSMEQKFGSILEGDFTIDKLTSLLRSGANDIDDICKLLPNADTQGIGLVVKGVPTSFPTLDPVMMLKKGKLPDLPEVGTVFLEAKRESKDQADDFLTLELPRFDF